MIGFNKFAELEAFVESGDKAVIDKKNLKKVLSFAERLPGRRNWLFTIDGHSVLIEKVAK